MAERRRIELPFPLKGIDRGGRVGKFDPLTTATAVNVTPYDTDSTRIRGGQRDGLRAAYLTDIGGPVRFLNKVDQVGTSTAAVYSPFIQYDTIYAPANPAFVDDIAQPPWNDPGWAGLFSGTMQRYHPYYWPVGGILIPSSHRMGNLQPWAGVAADPAGTTDPEAAIRDDLNYDTTQPYRVVFHIVSPFDAGARWQSSSSYDFDTDIYFWIRLDDTTPDGSDECVLLQLILTWTATTGSSYGISNDTITCAYSGNLYTRTGGSTVETQPFATGSDTDTSIGPTKVQKLGELQFVVYVDGDNVRAVWNGNELLTASGFDINAAAHTAMGTNSRYGFGCHISETASIPSATRWLGWGVKRVDFVGKSLSSAAVETSTATFLCATASGEFYQNDGTDFAFTTVGSADILQSDRWLSTAEYQQKLYIANHNDSTEYPAGSPAAAYVYDPAAGTVSTFAPTGYTAGASIFCVYRDALVAGGNALPNSFHIGPQGNPASAWTAGTDPGDPVVVAIPDTLTALIPHTDDLLVVGGANSLYVLKGHPNSGGVLDVVSASIGVQSRSAWTYGPKGDIYFLSRTGLYLFRPGDMRDPQPLSQTVLPDTPGLTNLSPSQYEFVLGYDPQLNGIWISATDKNAAGDGIHYFYSIATGGFFRQTFDSSVEPYCMYLQQSRSSAEARLLFGCADGKIRKFTTGTLDDDPGGTVIVSQLDIGPFPLSDIEGEQGRLDTLQIVMGSGSGGVQYEVFVGDAAEQLASFATGQVSGGLDHKIIIRASGAYATLRLFNLTEGINWWFETAYAEIRNLGRVRIA